MQAPHGRNVAPIGHSRHPWLAWWADQKEKCPTIPRCRTTARCAHLLAHGCFKAGLFLGAGSVMHGMDDETDMRRYGDLAKVMPVTAVTFGLGYLAIIGVPPLSGFFTKDGIIEAALGRGGAAGVLLGGAAILGAGITGFYMTRVMVLTFFGTPRWRDGAHQSLRRRIGGRNQIARAAAADRVSAGICGLREVDGGQELFRRGDEHLELRRSVPDRDQLANR